MSGIFARGRETVEVFPQVAVVDEFGNTVFRPGDPETDTPIVVARCVVQPMTEDADLSQGYRILSMYRVLCRKWPGAAKGIARWRGQLWDVVENPARRQYTPKTAHDTAYLKARTEEDFGGLHVDGQDVPLADS